MLDLWICTKFCSMIELYCNIDRAKCRLFVFGGVVGGACRLVEVVVVRWSLRRPVWMRLRMV